MMHLDPGYLGLFVVTFLAATVLPIASELFLTGMLKLSYDPWSCLLVATAGNSLGSMLNYGIGVIGHPKWLKRIGVKEETIFNWQARIQHYGSWMALLCWLPFIGDVIGVALGFFRAPMWRSFLLMTVGKFLRYAIFVLFFVH
ncbi:MAG: hypothetical protein RLZZ301_1471 [Bacteroidota bacterium]|jgi:membrane protein YqaA with SNARE-associated domain